MDGLLYIRLRGKVQGPFSAEKLQQLAVRGQFGRLHEVSTDGVAWNRATAYPELFPAPAPAQRQTGSAVAVSPTTTGAKSAVSSESVSDSGSVTPASTSTVLESPAPTLDSSSPAGSPAELGRRQRRRRASAAPRWVVILAVFDYGWAGLSAIAGLLLCYLGLQGGSSQQTVQGLLGLLYAVVIAVFARLLVGYLKTQGEINANTSMSTATAIRAQRTFWIFVVVGMIIVSGIVVWTVCTLPLAAG